MKRTFRLFLLAALLVAPFTARAMCYTVFDRKSDVLYRSDAPPFDLSLPTSVGITESRFAGGYLVIIPVNDEEFSGRARTAQDCPAWAGATTS